MNYDLPKNLSSPVTHSGMTEEDIARIRNMMGLFIDKIWFILGVTLIFFIGSVIFFYSQPNRYYARTQLMLKSIPEVFLSTKEFQNLMFMPDKSKTFYNTQMTLIRNRHSIKKLVEVMGLRAFGKEKQLLQKNIDELTGILMSRIGIGFTHGTELIDISVVLSDPVLTANVTNTLAEIYVEQHKSDTLALSRELAERILHTQQKGESKGKTTEIFESLLGGARNTVIGRLNQRRTGLQGQIDDLSLNYKEKFPLMIHFKRKVKELDREIARETRKAVDEWIQFLDGQDLLSGAIIIEYAQVPRTPIGPKRVRGILLVTLAGLAGAYGLVFLLYQFDSRVKSEEELIQQTGMVCLGIVPKLPRHQKADHYSELPPAIKDTMTYIRTAIRFSMPEDKSKVILTTSALRSEGKTTMSTHLASSFAGDGLRTVLIDGDTRRPRVHHIFHLNRTPGLTNFLNDSVALESIMVDSGTPNLTIIPAGEDVPNPSELLSSNKLKELMKHLRKEFDKIIVDTPPVLNIADGMILAPLADGVVLVINAERTEKRIIKKINEQFQQIGEKVIGGIINYYDTSKHSYYLNVYLRYEAEDDETDKSMTAKIRKFFKKTPVKPALKDAS